MNKALYALSIYVGAMALTRVILGSLLRRIQAKVVVVISIFLLLCGTSFLHLSTSYEMSLAGLIFLGAGLAAGFPVMLAFVGTHYADVSGTAFSIVISIALIGNILLNYGMGILVENFGIGHLTTLSFILAILMFILTITTFNKLKTK
jgi:MFS family permease